MTVASPTDQYAELHMYAASHLLIDMDSSSCFPGCFLSSLRHVYCTYTNIIHVHNLTVTSLVFFFYENLIESQITFFHTTLPQDQIATKLQKKKEKKHAHFYPL